MWRGAAPSAPPASRAGTDGQQFIPSLAELLGEGGDHRIRPDALTGLNAYGCAPEPDPDLAAFGSSTASTISAAAWDAAARLRERIADSLEMAPPAAVYERELGRIRRELVRLCGLETAAGLQVLFAPSGTDIHMLIAQLVGGDPRRPALAIIGEAGETGSGVPAALEGRSYSPSTPLAGAADRDAPIGGALAAETTEVPARAADGRLRDSAAVEAEIEALAAGAVREGRRVLLVITDVSKTGLISPSPVFARTLQARFPGRIDVLVDGCQLRLSAPTLRGYADLGWMIAVTGSKFLTGPAFSGAVFIPAEAAERFAARILSPRLRAYSARADWPSGWAMRAGLEPVANHGLLIRWEAALEELRRFAAIPERGVAGFLARFRATVETAMSASPALEPLAGRALDRGLCGEAGWDSAPTIFPFLLNRPGGAGRLTAEETRKVYALMRRDLGGRAGSDDARAMAGLRVEVGQPVACGVQAGAPAAALRLCASARLIAEACCGGAAAEQDILARARQALEKAAWLAGEVAEARL